MKASHPSSINRSKGGFTLVEILVSIGLLGMLSLGILATIMQARRMTEESIYLNTATAAAQGYIEQIKNMEFEQLDENPLPTLIDQGTADPLTVSPMVADPEVGGLGDIVNNKLIDINNTPANTTDDMPFSVVVYIEDITDAAAGIANSRRIILRYNYTFSDNGSTHVYTNNLSAVRSEIPTF